MEHRRTFLCVVSLTLAGLLSCNSGEELPPWALSSGGSGGSGGAGGSGGGGGSGPQEVQLYGSWKGSRNIVIEARGNSVVFTSFGESGLGRFPDLIKLGDPFLRNLVRKGTFRWSGEVVRFINNYGAPYTLHESQIDTLVEVKYVSTDLNINPANGTLTIETGILNSGGPPTYFSDSSPHQNWQGPAGPGGTGGTGGGAGGSGGTGGAGGTGGGLNLVCPGTLPSGFHCLEATPGGPQAPFKFEVPQLKNTTWVDLGIDLCISYGSGGMSTIKTKGGGLAGPGKTTTGKWGVLVRSSGVPEYDPNWRVFSTNVDPQSALLTYDSKNDRMLVGGWMKAACPW